MNPNPLSVGGKTGGNPMVPASGAAEPGHNHPGTVSSEGRDLNQEGQQFADLLRGRSEPTDSPMDLQHSESLSGRGLESPFSIAQALPAELAERDGTDHVLTQTGASALTGGKEGGQPTGPTAQVEREFAVGYNPSKEARSVAADGGLPTAFPGELAERDRGDDASTQKTGALPLTGGRESGQPTEPTAQVGRESAIIGANSSKEARSVAADGGLPTDRSTNVDSKPESPSGDRILQSLLGQPLQPTVFSPLEQPPSSVSGSDRVEQLAERLAQRILVSDRAHTTDSEVRIQLRDSVLQGAEITLRHDQGQLVVTFNVAHSDTAGLLLRQSDDLQRVLANKLNESVRIEVNVSSQGAGGQDQDGPGDGRSRNRRDLREEWGMEP